MEPSQNTAIAPDVTGANIGANIGEYWRFRRFAGSSPARQDEECVPRMLRSALAVRC
jgi:hypothetical protein